MQVTDSNINTYWYLGLDWLKNKMNRYFTDRYLRRNPFHYEFSYKLQCDGCSQCLNRAELQAKMAKIENDESQKRQTVSMGFLHHIFRRLFAFKTLSKSENVKLVEVETEHAKETIRRLIDKASISNEHCGRVHAAKLKQVQLISNINEPFDELSVSAHKHIDTVIVKDPQFNSNDMFLTMRKVISFCKF
jgi:hypothetical protein